MTSSNNKSVKTLKLNPLDNSTTSATSLHVRHSTSKSLSQNDEDEFYDAVDAVDGLSSASCFKNNNTKYFTYEEDDDNDRTFVFFDTATSRHASEMSTNESFINGNKSVTVSRTISIDHEENSIKDEKKALSQNDQNHETKHSNNTAEDDDEADAELETAWSFWIDKCVKGASKQDYEASIKLIHTVKTVQTFWSIYNHLPDVSTLPKSYSYHLMRNTRRPLWEDPENCRGGQWKLKCKKEDTSLVWYELLLAGIGEQLSDCVSPFDDIVGLSVGCRDKEDIIQIWNLDHKYYTDATIFEHIQDLVPNVKFSVKFYKPHNLHDAFENMSLNKNTTVQNYHPNNNNNNNTNHSSNHSNNNNNYNYFNNSKNHNNKPK